MKTLLDQFLAECADLLDQVDAGLLAMERDPADRSVLDEVFRAAHTIKGSSGLFDLPQLTRLTHAAEDLLDAVRDERVSLDAALVDALLSTFDTVRRWLDAVGRDGVLPGGAGDEAARLSAVLRAPIGGEPEPVARVPQPRRSADDVPVGPAPGWLLAGLGRDRVTAVADWLDHACTTCRVVRYAPSEQCFFSGDDPLYLVSQVPAIEDLAVVGPDAWPPLDEFDEYACRLTFTIVTRATPAELEHLFRYVVDEVEVAEVGAASLRELLAPPAPPTTSDLHLHPSAALSRSVLDAQLRALAVDLPEAQFDARVRSVATVSRSALVTLGLATDDLDTAAERCLASLDVGPLVAAIGAVIARLAPPEPDAATPDAATPDAGSPDAGSPDAATPDPASSDAAAGDAAAGDAAAADAATPGAGPESGPDPAPTRGRTPSRVLKVDQATVDRLLDLVGQLVVAKNGLPFLAAAAEEEWNARALGRQIKDQYAVVNRISEELQAAVMDVRMLPMSTAFARFPRLVRDIARSLGKEVLLEQEGEDTAADKDVIEMLGDPLVHLVRNSLDHGIESPQERAAAGKPAQARLLLRAAQEPDAVVVDIVDDGRGIDPERVKRRAYERGLITEEQLETMTDAEATELVFAAGFSTAAAVSDLSGRGVGMDAVQAAVRATGGTVRLFSTPGRGTHVQLRVPLSLAVSRVMIVTVRGQRLGVPLDLVIETVRVPRSRVARVEQQQVVVLRESVVPLVHLAQALQLTEPPADEDLVSVLVTRLGGQEVGLVVDAFHEGAEVIVKPCEGILAGIREFSGTALMGDGSVLLVLDVKEVLAGAGDDH